MERRSTSERAMRTARSPSSTSRCRRRASPACPTPSWRRRRPSAAPGAPTTLPNIEGIKLVLEKTGTVTVNVYLPDDHGASSGTLVPLVNLHIRGPRYDREAQALGQPVTFAKLLTHASEPFSIEAKEQGG